MSILIENKTFPRERDLYGIDGAVLKNCRFEGAEDGESALKEAKNVELKNCYMDLRYPLWHDENATLSDVEMTENCRAALWYTHGIVINNSKLFGIKALRECSNANITGTQIRSPEFGWKCQNVNFENCEIESEYLLLLSSDVTFKNVNFKGKYSFQYVQNALIENSVLNTKDAFWHTKNVTVKNCVLKGEYLAWYSENLTLINCKIIGTQPFCYCSGLKLINCETEGCDFSFEYSDVNADIKGDVLSIKNPKSGKIICDSAQELIYTDDSKYPCACEIILRKKQNN